MIRGHRLLVLCRGDALFTKWPLFQARAFCTAKAGQDERYRQLENLDMVTAAKILFDEPPKKKKLDFHLVQLFFACMPSLEISVEENASSPLWRHWDTFREILEIASIVSCIWTHIPRSANLAADVFAKQGATLQSLVEAELKRLADEVKKVKEMKVIGEEEVEADSELSKVKERMDALEAELKEIVDETKKLSETHIKDKEELKTEQVGHSPSNCVNTTELTQTDGKGKEVTKTELVGPGDNNSRNKSDGSSTQAAESEYKSVSREE